MHPLRALLRPMPHVGTIRIIHRGLSHGIEAAPVAGVARQAGDRLALIEVNDNPSIDAGVEDAYLGDDLYRRIMGEFLRRLERKRLGLAG